MDAFLSFFFFFLSLRDFCSYDKDIRIRWSSRAKIFISAGVTTNKKKVVEGCILQFFFSRVLHDFLLFLASVSVIMPFMIIFYWTLRHFFFFFVCFFLPLVLYNYK